MFGAVGAVLGAVVAVGAALGTVYIKALVLLETSQKKLRT